MATISTDLRAGGSHDFSVWQMRLERWRRVRHLLDRAELATGRLRSECAQAAASELQLLRDGEALWIYPGLLRIGELRRELGDHALAAAATAARRIVRLLELYGDAAAVADRDVERTARYFTALVVADDAQARAATLASALEPLRRDADARDYALLPVGSIEEALVAIRCNPWVEAALLGVRAPRFAARATGLASVEERRLLGTLGGDDAAALAWLDEWLHAERPALMVAPLTLPLGELHALLSGGRRATAT